MLRCFLRSKIHMATVTDSHLFYEGSITVDKSMLKKVGIAPYEQVVISNVNNGERFDTYVIPGGKGEFCLNGPTARKGEPGDKIIIFCYGYVDEKNISEVNPIIIKLDEKNRIVK